MGPVIIQLRRGARLLHAAVGGVLLALSLAASPAYAQAQTAIDTSAEVLDNLSIIKTQDMDFGFIIAPNAGRVDMTAETDATCTTNNGLVQTGPCEAAAFAGVSLFGLTMRVRMPPGRRVILTGPGADMRVVRLAPGGETGMTFVGRQGRNYRYLITDVNGNFTFFVGGRLRVNNNQAAGVYTGTFDVVVDYN